MQKIIRLGQDLKRSHCPHDKVPFALLLTSCDIDMAIACKVSLLILSLQLGSML